MLQLQPLTTLWASELQRKLTPQLPVSLLCQQAGQLLTGSLMDYAVPRAEDMPELTIASRCTPSATNLLGSKGVGEAGCIGVPAAIMNAARDALAPRLGEVQLDFPLHPQRLWALLHTSPNAHQP